MRRAVLGFVISMAAMSAAAPSLAADIDLPSDIRTGYNGWEEKSWDPLMEFEAGLRYVYSQGGSWLTTSGNPSLGTIGSAGGTLDTTHFLEAHLRMNDLATDTYLSAYAGYSAALQASYASTSGGVGTTNLGKVGYAVADFGYMPLKLGDDNFGGSLGGFIGYQYMHEAPNIGSGTYRPITADSSISWVDGSDNYFLPVAYADHAVNVNALRLGVTGKAHLGAFDVRADVAAIPYASITGVLGTHSVPTTGGTTRTYQATESRFSGSGYGAAADLTLGYNITDNMAIRFGGRATYIRGQGDLVYGLADVTSPVDADGDGTYEIAPSTGGTYYLPPESLDALHLWRYGLMAELTVKF